MLINLYLWFLMIFGLIKLVLNFKHLLNLLMIVEFMMMNILLLMVIFLMKMESEFYFFMLFMIMMVCEGVLGLVILILMVRSYGNDYFYSLNLMLW
uniref:NADH-ubiquinone oxidoreductase chain 4L n=1 Tax=Macrostemum floridum TaxID=486976 RepID=A0A7L8XGD6_9NEOP|nr:NADH dehydrogenase subunit 4L [Macrostemum floridum]QOH91261.1 NADH dehydrogenase subunit 4L [Macrostemum floridum]